DPLLRCQLRVNGGANRMFDLSVRRVHQEGRSALLHRVDDPFNLGILCDDDDRRTKRMPSELSLNVEAPCEQDTTSLPRNECLAAFFRARTDRNVKSKCLDQRNEGAKLVFGVDYANKLAGYNPPQSLIKSKSLLPKDKTSL